MECHGRMKPVLRLRANAVLHALAPGAVGEAGGNRGMHFASGTAASDDEQEHAPPSRRWYRAAYARLLRLAGSLRGVELCDGRVRHAATGSVVADAHVATRVADFDALAGKFTATQHQPALRAMSLSSLTRVCDVLGVSAQLRKSVRLTICPQVTQHHIWRGALEEVLRDLQADMGSLKRHSLAIQMAEQIASACASFLSYTADAAMSSSPSWMRPTPFKKPTEAPPPAKTRYATSSWRGTSASRRRAGRTAWCRGSCPRAWGTPPGVYTRCYSSTSTALSGMSSCISARACQARERRMSLCMPQNSSSMAMNWRSGAASSS